VTKLAQKCGLDFFSLEAGWASFTSRRSRAAGGTVEFVEGPRHSDPGGLCEETRALLQLLGLRILIEPGRFIVGNAGILVTRVEYVKRTGRRTSSSWTPP
jgi:diaminopimelate decarboxylase